MAEKRDSACQETTACLRGDKNSNKEMADLQKSQHFCNARLSFQTPDNIEKVYKCISKDIKDLERSCLEEPSKTFPTVFSVLPSPYYPT